jgi:hypothetical protein
MDDAERIGDAAYNLAAASVSLKQYDRARTLLAEARAEYRRAGVPITDVLLVEAKVARLQGRADEAVALADAILTQQSPPAAASDRVRAQVIKGEIACEARDAAGAAAALAAARGELRGGGGRSKDAGDPDAALAAGVAGLEGCVATLRGEPANAADAFDRAAALWRQARQYHPMARSLGRAAAAYREAGEARPAADRYYRAARSTFGQRELEDALDLARSAAQSAGEAGDEDLRRRAEALLAEIAGAAPGAGPEAVPETPLAPTLSPDDRGEGVGTEREILRR